MSFARPKAASDEARIKPLCYWVNEFCWNGPASLFLLSLELLVQMEEAVHHDSCKNDEVEYRYSSLLAAGKTLVTITIYIYILFTKIGATLAFRTSRQSGRQPIDRPTMEVRPECGPPAGNLGDRGAG